MELKMPKVKTIFAGLLGLFLLAALPVHAQQPGSDDDQPRPHFNQAREIFKELNLTDDQRKQLEANKQEHRSRMQMARQQIKTTKEALRQELMKPQLDMPKIHQLHRRIKDLLSQMEDDKLNSILAVRTILTPEQFMKFNDLMHHNHPDHD
jgi:Spy/CpxP family protein refolding chaperone